MILLCSKTRLHTITVEVESPMTIDPENGFHVGTVVSCIFGVTGQTVYNCLLLPCLPFMIKYYYPDVSLFYVIEV